MSIDLSAINLTLCQCFEITTNNNLVARFTDFSENLTFLGETYQAIPIWRSKISYHSDLQVDKVDVSMGLVGITVGEAAYTIPQAIKYGYLRNSHVKIYIVNFVDTSEYDLIFEGWANEDLSYNKGILNIGVGSILDRLDDKFPKLIYSEYCNHKLFSTYCGLNSDDYKVSSTALTNSTTVLIYSTDFLFAAHAEGYWEKGKITMTSGDNTDISRSIVKHYDGYIRVLINFPSAVANGNTFNVWPGCDKRGETCADRFNNYTNFLGFEYIPRSETLYTGL